MLNYFPQVVTITSTADFQNLHRKQQKKWHAKQMDNLDGSGSMEGGINRMQLC